MTPEQLEEIEGIDADAVEPHSAGHQQLTTVRSTSEPEAAALRKLKPPEAEPRKPCMPKPQSKLRIAEASDTMEASSEVSAVTAEAAEEPVRSGEFQ